ncbi:MAG: YbbR-like domain-containing protein [Candidatus Saccharicenans sp.]|jgi:YbbR domain-containing protein|nr:YbbR-like domain-containing protein [Candidatus Saccharicenans sp.]
MLKDFLTRNWELKLLAIFLAIIVWIVMIPEEKTFAEKTLSLNLELINLPQDIEVVEKSDTTVNLKIRARKRVINQLAPDDFSAQLDMSKASVYQEEYPINSSLIKTPPGVEVISFSPVYIHVKLEKTKKIEMEVVPTIIGKLAEDLRLAKVEVNPSKVTVSGPESKVRAKDKVITSPIDVSALTDSAVVEVDLILPRPELRLLALYPRARVNIVIEKKNGSNPNPETKKVKK